MSNYLLYSLLDLVILFALSAGFAGIKMLIHNFLNFGYNYYLWIQYTAFFFIALSLPYLLSYIITITYGHLWLILFVILTIEFLVFYRKYYKGFPKKTYFGFLLSSTFLGISLVALTSATFILEFRALWTLFIKFTEGTWF